jgi:hypothetical protein
MSTIASVANQYRAPEEWIEGLPPALWTAERTYQDRKPLPALAPKTPSLSPERQAVLLGVYSEVCGGWRTLTDVRFKLLGLLPVVSIGVLITLLSATRGPTAISAAARTTVALLGLLLTGAIRLYDLRNTDLYNDLVGRGRQIEAELGIHTGQFRGRPDSRGLIQHDVAIRAVYVLSAAAWVIAAIPAWLA